MIRGSGGSVTAAGHAAGRWDPKGLARHRHWKIVWSKMSQQVVENKESRLLVGRSR
jgi:hypothetical protein